ncbi:hypothetical protein IV38_GL000131 [Lactobacillus selangorensis]|uniref:Uncharacterized protein n=2 Tax=Lactobacillus selangorensis TaxID=81857 RepID=A0A0R2FMI0_9LACO|nr:hypothetical protein IV38_GL000131 [Lactobacillus selangorensis]KRN29793.1 hypothetical protein IV40_GL000594 [Lactobacillus selangorensis]
MVTQGDTFSDAVYWAKDVIITMLADSDIYPKGQDPSDWKLNDNDRLVYITVNKTI